MVPSQAHAHGAIDAILHGDCLGRLRELADGSVDLAAIDPPYGIDFLDKDWDKAVPSVEVWRECYRVLKPGAFAFVMSAPRQDVLSRMIVNLGDAGFDTSLTSIYWSYASGFPKASNISKAAKKRALATGDTAPDHLDGSYAGFQPKPAVEVVIVVMKPLSEKTYLDQAMSNRKGVTWLDDCRIPVAGEDTTSGGNGSAPYVPSAQGRFPANLLVSDGVLDDGTVTTSRPTKGGGKLNGCGVAGGGLHAGGIKERMGSSFADSGGNSRYFDLDAWWTRCSSELPESVRATLPFIHVSKPSKKEKQLGCAGTNHHPTVKPLALMSYLITLGSRRGDLVLDPYAGSGTTCVAAKMLGRHYIGIEREADYVKVARSRLAAVPDANAPVPAAKRPSDPRLAQPSRPADVRLTGSPRKVEPLVKWVGGKRNLLPQLEELFPASVSEDFDGRLVEPFAGGLALFFHLRPKEALLADLNAELINFYTQVRDDLDDLLPLIDALAKRPYTAETYYEVRSSTPKGAPERAARFLYLNKYGFNGLYRVNRKGSFNVSFGRTASGKRPELYDEDNIRAASSLLQRAELLVSPFERTLKRVRRGDFAYLDPPYEPVSSTSAFTAYTKTGFSYEDQKRVRDQVLRMTRMGAVPVLLSNSNAPSLLDLYAPCSGLHVHEVRAQRAVSAAATGRGPVTEVVITNYPVSERRAA